jgi:hypothetical protein
MSLTNTYENAALDTLIRGQAWTPPTHLALFTADPGEAGSLASEVSGGSYARVAIGTPGTFWSAASGGATSNAAAIDWPAASAPWGTITHVGLMTAASGGAMVTRAALGASKVIDTGDIFRILAGQLAVTAD